jgi:hypothetical protein
MKIKFDLLRPATFEPGAAYLRIERPVQGDNAPVLPVWFVSYDPCPAFVIVQAGDGSRLRYPRDEIFLS